MDDLRIEAMFLWAFAIMGLTVNVIAVIVPRPQAPVEVPHKIPVNGGNTGNYTTPSWVHAPENVRYQAMRSHLDSICNNLK